MQGSCMSKHENNWYAICRSKKFFECICMMMQWLMQNVRLEYDNEQMQERYIHYDAMKRCLCDAWYECIYRHESPENYLFLLAHLGVQCPMCVVKKVIWIFRLPMTERRDLHTTRAWRHDADAKKHNTGMYIAWQYPQIIIQQRHTWHLDYMHGNV